LRRFTVKLAMAALAVGGGYWGAQWLARASREPGSLPASPTAPAVSNSDLSPAVASGESGDSLVLKVLDTLERRPNIVAKVRHSLMLGDRRLSGEGEFWQQGVGNQRRSRWDVKTLVDGDAGFITQVYDGEDVWIDRRLREIRKTSTISMAKVRRKLSAAPAGEGPQSNVNGVPFEVLARGGLSQLVAGLERAFTFAPPHPLQRGERMAQATIGIWRPEQLERLWPGLSVDDIAAWPAHLPHHVLLLIDNDSRFPYLVEYRGANQAGLALEPAGRLPAREPLATFEFIDVQFASAMPANAFEFSPKEMNLHDVTNRVLEYLQPPAASAETTSARRPGTWR
jgi:hypothetical protein